MATTLFTLQEASSLIPWLKGRFDALDAARGAEERTARRQAALVLRSRSNGKDGVEPQIAALNREMQKRSAVAADILSEITDRGIVVRNIAAGLVDFPAIRDGERVFLCWTREEDAIRYWHHQNEGFASRKPLS